MVEAADTYPQHRNLFQEIATNDRFLLINEHQNIKGEFTLVFEDQTTGAKYTFANVNPTNVPEDLLPEEYKGNLQEEQYQVVHMPLNQVLSNIDKFKLITHHKNVRGDLTLVFEEKLTGTRYSFSNVNPDHVPLSVLPLDQRDNAHTIHVHLDEILKNMNLYKLITHHQNFKGDYTLVFEDTTGRKFNFANVNPENLPEEMRNKYGIKGSVHHFHVEDMLNHLERYELIQATPHLSYTLVFRDKETDHRHAFSHVNPTSNLQHYLQNWSTVNTQQRI